MVPIGSKRVFLDYGVQRLECRRCGTIRQEKLGFADPRFSYGHAFERYALDLSKHMTIQSVPDGGFGHGYRSDDFRWRRQRG